MKRGLSIVLQTGFYESAFGNQALGVLQLGEKATSHGPMYTTATSVAAKHIFRMGSPSSEDQS